MHDNLLLRTSEGGQAEDGVQDGESGGGDFPPLVEGLARVGMIMRYLSIRRVPKTLSGDDQPDWLLLNQDNGENWLGFTGRRRPRKLSLEQIATAGFSFGTAGVSADHRHYRRSSRVSTAARGLASCGTTTSIMVVGAML